MNEPEPNIADSLACRSLGTVTAVTFLFAVGGALTMAAEMFMPNGFSMLWCLWIPLCFMLIPSVHALARQNRELRERLDALELSLANVREQDGG